ncbi:gamma-glutamylcyclotransferase family protein [Bythopirellula polymerisocia]|uniref:Putative gamma-glutamylcyclotransferase n=1 Tax=Bythopirellula polymerisocia TaxID=2528003 RepID=A0A5C6CGI9_9BACT|nr:gamma-glutamylcyclotransferase family protein [Bythopirellula polymerisocia]TWU22837.1 AIG2-like family protein [Bythopirellula polymerisocia]
MRLFTYGTLMFPEVWQRISIGEFPARPATLRGYAIFRVKNAVYPGIIRAEEDLVVNGLLYDDLDDDTLFELDTYESSFYKRIPVVAITADGAEQECHAYVVPDNRRDLLTDESWDAVQFRKSELEKYLHGQH